MNTYSWNPSSNCTKVWTDPNCWTNGQFPGPAPSSLYAPQGNVTINLNEDLTISFNDEKSLSIFIINDLKIAGSGSLTIVAPKKNVALQVLGTLSGSILKLNLTGGSAYTINDATGFSGNINISYSSLSILLFNPNPIANFSNSKIALIDSNLSIANQFDTSYVASAQFSA
jgi:hypothetical protein